MNTREQAEDLYNRILDEKIIIDSLDYSSNDLEKQNIDLYNRRIDIIEKFIEEIR
jgi:hypothetical protein